ncbi:MAG: cysteine hydrolase [Clostridia bacterium]|nr:cysteine hydrolase [Clostridia bacterium]
MKKLLIVVDMQNDFVTGSLGTKEAEKIVQAVVNKVQKYKLAGDDILFTRDTHTADYLQTQEGKKLPVEHCIEGTWGWEIIDELKPYAQNVFNKPTFGSLSLVESVVQREYSEIELVGLCTDICVVSNALLLKTNLLDTEITVDASCCAGVTPETHQAALATMKMCQVNIC